MDKITGYIGTYASPESLGVYRFTLDLENGRFTEPELYLEAPDAKYVSVRKGILAAPVLRDGMAGLCVAEAAAEKARPKAEIRTEQKTPCFVVQDETFIYTANYHEGSVLIYERNAGEPRLVKRIETEPGAGCHQVLLHGRYMLVPCLMLDRIRIYDREQDFALAGSISFPKGSGPRHGIFTEDHSRLFVVTELSSEVCSFRVAETSAFGKIVPEFRLEQTVPIFSDGSACETAPSSAAVRLSPDEKRLYVSTRGADLLTVYEFLESRLTLQQQTGSGGVHPRDFTLTPDGRYLLAVNRYQGGLVCFRLSGVDGSIGGICSRVPAPEGVSVVLDIDN